MQEFKSLLMRKPDGGKCSSSKRFLTKRSWRGSCSFYKPL